MNVYSGEGDDGSTRTMRPGRLSKADLLIEVLGEIDEASASLAWSFSQLQRADIKPLLSSILNDLSMMMALLAGDEKAIFGVDRIRWLENMMEEFGTNTQDVHGFVLEWKNPASVALNVSRTIIRRTERSLVRLAKKRIIQSELLGYFNRLSSLTFLLQLAVESGDIFKDKSC